MNSFYRVVFCKSTGVFKAVSELAKSGKKTKSISIAAGVLASSLVMSSAAIAAVGDPIASGDAIGLNALAVGETNTVDGNRSTAIGSENGVSGESNTALGVNNKINPTEDYLYNGDGDGMQILLTPSIRSTAIGVENTIEGNESVANGVFNKAKANNVTITGGRNEVSSKESGTYGQGNYVGKDMVVPALGRVRVDDGYRIGYRGYINEGSYAYGNSNQVLGDKSHAVGNSNNVSGDKNGLLGNGNSLSTEKYEQPRRMATARMAVGDGELSRAIVPVSDGGLPRNRWDGRDEGSFLVGNENEVNGINTHAVGNQNQIRNDDNVTLGSGNRVEFYQNDHMGEATRMRRDDSDRIMLRSNTSTAIVGANNRLEAAGVHIVGTENNIQQAYSYVVGGGNTIESSFSSPMIIAGAPESGSNVFGSGNDIESEKSSVVGDSNRIDQKSLLAVVTGSENNISGVSSSTVGNNNQIRKDVGGAHGTMNKVQGNAGALQAINAAYDAYNSGEAESFEGLDLDKDGVVDFATVEEFMLMVNKSGSYAYGNINNIQGEGIHTVGNNNEFSGNNNKGVGNNNRIGQVGGMVGNSDAVLPTAKFYDSATYGDFNVVNADSAQTIGNENVLGKEFSSVTGYNNSVVQGLSGELVDVTTEQRRIAGTFVSGNDNSVESHGGVVSGSGNEFQADRATLSGSENIVIGDEGHVVGNDNEVYGKGNNGFGNNNVIGKVMNGDHSSVDSSHIVGNNNTVEGNLSSAFGNKNTVSGDETSVIGLSNTTDGEGSLILGNYNENQSSLTTMVGGYNNIDDNYSDNAVAVGQNNSLSGNQAAAFGNKNSIEKDASGAIGVENYIADGFDRNGLAGEGLAGMGDGIDYNKYIERGSYAQGNKNDVRGDTTHVYGYQNGVLGNKASVMGANNSVSGNGTQVIGNDNTIGYNNDGMPQYGDNIAVLGSKNTVEAENSFVVGSNNTVDRGADGSLIFGSNASSSVQNGVAIGNGSTVGRENTVSFGSAGEERQLTNVADATESKDAVNLGQLNASLRDTTGDENITATKTDTGYNVALNKNVALDSVTTGTTSMGTNGVRAGDVFLSSTSGLDNAGNRITSVGDAIENTDAVNFGQFKAGLTDTTAGKNVAVRRTDTGYEVSVLDDITLNSMTAGTTVVNTNGFQAGAVTITNTGLDNANNRVTSVADAIERSDAVNYGQFTDGLAGTIKSVTGDENVVAVTDANKNVTLALQKDVVVDSVTTGATSFNTDGVRAGDVFLSSATGLDNAGNRITSVGDAIENTDAVNFGQFKAGLTDTTAGKNVNVTRTDTGYEVALNDNVNVNSLTAGTTVVNTDGVKVGGVTVKSTGLDNAGNRVTSVGDAVAQTDAVNLKQLNASLRDTTGDENITATKTDTGYNVALNKNVALDSVTTGTTSMGTDGVRAGDVFLSSTSGLDNAGNRVTSVGDAIIRSDAVNYGQFTDGLAGTIKSVTGDENVVAVTDANKNVNLVLQKNVVVDSVTTGATSFSTDGVRAGDVVLSSTTGLSNAGNRVTLVGDAIERSDAVNYGQFQDGLNGISKTTVDGDKNIIATKNATGYDLALNKDLEAETLTTGNTVINNNGLTNGTTSVDASGFKAGSVTVSSTGVDNAGNRVTSVGDAIAQDDAVNLKQLNASVRDTSAGKNIAVKRTDTGFEVALDNDITLGSVTTGNTLVNDSGVKVGDVTVKSTGVDNAGNRVTSVGDAIVRSDAVNYGQFTDGLAGTIKSVTGDENVVAVTDANKNVTLALQKDVVVDSLTTGNTLVNNSGMKVGDVTVRSTGLDNANNRVTSVADAIERSDAVNYGQFQDGLNGLTKTTVAGDKNITSTKTDTGYDLTLNDNLVAESVTTGNTVVNTDGVKVGDVTVKSTGVDNAGNRVTSVGDAIENTDAVNLKQLNASLRDTTGDENITATKTDTGYNVALNRNLALDSVATGSSYFNTDGFRAGEVFLSSTSGLSNAGYRITKVGDAVAQDDAVNLGQVSEVDDRLTQVNNQQNSAIIGNISNIAGNTAAINQGFNVGNGSTSNKFDLGDTVDITADSNTVVTTTPTGVQVGLNKDLAVDSVTTGNTSISNAGVTVGGVSITDTSGLNNAGFTVSGVGNAVNRDEAINKGQFDDAIRDLDINGVTTKVTGDSNIIATTVGTNVSLELAKDIKVDSVTTGNSSMSNDGFKTGDVTITANSGLNNAGFTVSGVGDAVKQDDAVNLKQLGAVEDRLDRENAAQNVVINNKADKSYVDAADQNLQAQVDKKVDRSEFTADQARQDAVIQTERDVRDAADKDLQAQVDKKVEKEVFEADQARQDAALKAESDVRDASDKDLQAQVDKKVEKEVFEADQARQDAAIKDMASMDFVNQQVSSSTIINNDKFEAMANKQKETDNLQDVRITNNETLINDLGYKVDGLEDKLSAGVASAIAFASMPSASKNGEVRLSGGSGYFNGAGALAVGLTGASETGEYTYKFGGSYTKDGGAVVGAGISYRIW